MNYKLIAACSVAVLAAACRKTDSTQPTKDPVPAASILATPPSPPAEPPALPSKPADRLALQHEHSDPVNHLDRSRELRERGDEAGALVEAQRALFDSPESEEALAAIAKSAEASGKKELAVLALERLAKLEKDNASPLERQARLLISLNRTEEAVKAGREAIARDPEDPDAYQVTGRAFLAQRELASAIKMFERVIELSADHGYAWNNFGFACLLANENDDALNALTRAAELLPDVAYVQNNLGIALERAGRLDEAMRAFTTATQLSPKYVKAKLNLQRLEQLAATGEMPDAQQLDDDCLERMEALRPE